jgi:hypothetical protein
MMAVRRRDCLLDCKLVVVVWTKLAFIVENVMLCGLFAY